MICNFITITAIGIVVSELVVVTNSRYYGNNTNNNNNDDHENNDRINADHADNVNGNPAYGSYYYKGLSIQTRWCEDYNLQLFMISMCNSSFLPSCCSAEYQRLHTRSTFCAATETGYRYPFIYKFFNYCSYVYHMCILYNPEDLHSTSYPCLFPIGSVRRKVKDCKTGKYLMSS